MKSTPKLSRVIRQDSIKLDDTYYTNEGYLVDHPIVTSIGIFEYVCADGTVRRELRLPEEVFDPESLKSYKTKPVIITHNAGTIDKDNVEDEIIGTILSDGYKDGDDVRVEIVIHDTDAMKECGLRELSLGYSLDLEETPGVWQGQKYDAIQRNIRVNHLALVDKARAGDQARLNVDGRDNMIGGKISMSKKTQSAALKSSIARFKARRTKRMDEAEAENQKKGLTPEELVQLVKDRRDRRDAEGDPETTEAAMGTIAQQDEDLDTLLEVIGTLMAEKDFDADCSENTDEDETDPDAKDHDCDGTENEDKDDAPDAGDPDASADEEDPDEEEGTELNPENADEDEGDPDTEAKPAAKADRKDSLSEHLRVCRMGDKLHLDGLDRMSILAAKKAVIRKVRPGIRLDGKNRSYIDAAYDMAVQEIKSRKSTDYQRGQMMGGKRRADSADSNADVARQKMIARNQRKEGTK